MASERAQLDKLHPADLADILEDLDYKKRTDFIEDLDVETVAEAFAEMEADTQIEILEHHGQPASVGAAGGDAARRGRRPAGGTARGKIR